MTTFQHVEFMLIGLDDTKDAKVHMSGCLDYPPRVSLTEGNVLSDVIRMARHHRTELPEPFWDQKFTFHWDVEDSEA